MLRIKREDKVNSSCPRACSLKFGRKPTINKQTMNKIISIIIKVFEKEKRR